MGRSIREQADPDGDVGIEAHEPRIVLVVGGPRLAGSIRGGRLQGARSATLQHTLQHALARTDDFLEGVGAFIEKREPRFTGA